MTGLRSIVCATALAAVVIAAPGCSGAFGGDRYQEEVHTKVGQTPEILHVEDPVGTITIQAWTHPYVQIDALKKASSIEAVHAITVPVQASGSRLDVTAQMGSNGHGSVDFTIHAPATTSINVDSSVGHVEIDGFRRDVSVTADVGKVTIAMAQLGKGQLIDARSSVGKIELSLPHDADAAIQASAEVGSIDGNNVSFSLQHHTVGADGSAKLGSGGAAVHLTTSTGSITVNRE